MAIYFAPDWCGLKWTEWLPLEPSKRSLGSITTGAGIYRVRITGTPILAYVGETGRNVRERLAALARGTHATLMPFNDPHTAAPSLWALRDSTGCNFECSAAETTLSMPDRRGLECYLLWQYRLAIGHSTECNYGRFPAGYTKSANRKSGIRGARLVDGSTSPAGGESIPPLQLIGSPLDGNWMDLDWCSPVPLTSQNTIRVPREPGVYKVMDLAARQVVYIGESSNLRARLATHCRADWDCRDPACSFVRMPAATYSYQRHEVENDLIAGFFGRFGHASRYQFAGMEIRSRMYEATVRSPPPIAMGALLPLEVEASARQR